MKIQEAIKILEQFDGKTPVRLLTRRKVPCNFKLYTTAKAFFSDKNSKSGICLVRDDEEDLETVNDLLADLRTRKDDVELFTDHNYLDEKYKVVPITVIKKIRFEEHYCGYFKEDTHCTESLTCKDCPLTALKHWLGEQVDETHNLKRAFQSYDIILIK